MKVRAVVKVTAEILILFYALLICGFVGFEKVFNFVKCLMFAIFLAIGHLAILFAICYFDILFAICNFAIFFLVTFKEISKFLFQWLFGFIGLILYFLVMLLEKWEKNLVEQEIWSIPRDWEHAPHQKQTLHHQVGGEGVTDGIYKRIKEEFY